MTLNPSLFQLQGAIQYDDESNRGEGYIVSLKARSRSRIVIFVGCSHVDVKYVGIETV